MLSIDSANGKIQAIQYCCVSSDYCNLADIARKVYSPLPFKLNTCFDNTNSVGAIGARIVPCKTSCEVSFFFFII
jgi:hypothetical protein